MVPDPPLATLASVKYGVPLGGVGDVIRRDYGYAVPWVIVPLGALSLGLALLVSIRELVSRRAGRAVDLLVLSFPALIALRLSPSLSIARFNVHIVTSLMFAVSWLAGQKRWHRWGEGAVAAAIALSIIPFFWMQGVLWNFRFSNRVEYIEFTRSDEFLERLAQFQSKWVAVGASSPARGALDSRPRDWEFVGEAAHAGTTVIYRHR